MGVGPFARVANQCVRTTTLNTARAFNHVARLPLTCPEAIDVVTTYVHVVPPGVEVRIESATGQDNARAAKLSPAIGSDAVQEIFRRVDECLPSRKVHQAGFLKDMSNNCKGLIIYASYD